MKYSTDFSKDSGTRNAIIVLGRILERAIEKQKYVYVCFIDYSKAFDKVRHVKLFQLLKELNVDFRNIELLKNLYWDQKAAMRVESSLSDWFSIIRGVRQGYVVSPHFFSLYTEIIMRKIDQLEGILIALPPSSGVYCTDSR